MESDAICGTISSAKEDKGSMFNSSSIIIVFLQFDRDNKNRSLNLGIIS